MKISRTGVFMSLSVFFLLASCASAPELPSDSRTAVPAASGSLIAAEPEAVPASETAVMPEAAVVPEAAVTETDAIPEEPAPETDELPVPEQIDTVPPLPSAERILYFYPEPDDLYVPPAETPATPKVAAPKAAAPKAAVPKAAVIPAVPATATSAPAAADPAAVQTEKPVEAVLPGIWVGESAPTAAVEKIPPVPPSRAVSLAAGQTLEVWYPGSGWVYLGDSSAQNGLVYEARKLDKTDTLFTFKALKSGNYILDFSRFDLLEDAFSSDSLAVEVSDTASKRTEKIRAPNYRNAGTASSATGTQPAPVSTVTPAGSLSLTMTDEPGLASAGLATTTATASAAAATGSSAATAASAPIDAEAALAQAKKALAANNPVSALEQLDRFFTAAVSTLDEGWFLRGQAYEANGASRDIRKALSAYETLVSAYPESVRWKEADARIRYIKQFYLRIR